MKSNLKRNGRSLFIVDARCVFHDDGHLRFIEHRLGNHSQHSTRPHESQFKFSVCTLRRRINDKVQKPRISKVNKKNEETEGSSDSR